MHIIGGVSYFVLCIIKNTEGNQTFFVEFFVSYLLGLLIERTSQRVIGAFFLCLNVVKKC